MRFASPNLLWLLVVIPPALVAFLWWSAKRNRALLSQFVEQRLLDGLLAGVSPARRRLRHGLLVSAMACFIVALARPQWGFDWEEVKQRGLDVVVAIDTSKSMLAEDVPPSRLTRAKLAALELLQQAKSDRVGLIAFAGSAFLQCPLTIDDAAFAECVEALDVNIIPQGGTAIAEAISTAMKSFKSGPEDHKVLVIFSDGEDHDARAVEVAAEAARAGIKIFTVGIGTAEGDLLRYRTPDGRTDYVRDPDGNVVKSRLNESWLQEIATAGGGFYLPLRGAKTIETLYERGIAPLPKSEGQAKLVKRWHEQFHWPLLLGFVLLIAETVLPERARQGRAPVRRSAFIRPLARLLRAPQEVGSGAVLALLVLPHLANGSAGGALRDYQAGRFAESLKEYERLLEKGASDARLRFNAGTAAYRLGNFDVAAKHFSEALGALPVPLQQRAYYNLGNALYRLGERESDLGRRRASWQQALKQYELALKLDSQDQDAKFNYEFVKRKLEELEQQLQEQQPSKSAQSREQDRPETQPSEDQTDQRETTGVESQRPPDPERRSPHHHSDDHLQEQKASPAEQSGKEQNQPAEPAQAARPVSGQMTPEVARQILDALRAEETMIPWRPEGVREPPGRVFKDW